MAIVVIGATGFVGSCLYNCLQKKGFKVYGTSTREQAEDEIFKLDITKKKDFNKIPKDIYAIFHIGAFIPERDSINYAKKCFMTNSIGTLNVLEFCRKRDIKLINSSSVSVYGSPLKLPIKEEDPTKPDTYYGASKLMGEIYCDIIMRKYGLKCISLRYSSIYGKGQRNNTVLPFFIKRVKCNKDLIVFGNGKRIQDFVYIKDVINANLKALHSNKNRTYNIGSGKPTNMVELANLIIKKFSKGNLNVVLDKNKNDTTPSILMDISKAKRELGYKVKYYIEKGLEDYKRECSSKLMC